jgi:hypothetical protein
MRSPVPDWCRITMLLVVAPPAKYRTPRSRSPSETPVAAKKICTAMPTAQQSQHSQPLCKCCCRAVHKHCGKRGSNWAAGTVQLGTSTWSPFARSLVCSMASRS